MQEEDVKEPEVDEEVQEARNESSLPSEPVEEEKVEGAGADAEDIGVEEEEKAVPVEVEADV